MTVANAAFLLASTPRIRSMTNDATTVAMDSIGSDRLSMQVIRGPMIIPRHGDGYPETSPRAGEGASAQSANGRFHSNPLNVGQKQI